jgi:hypothetical protein
MSAVLRQVIRDSRLPLQRIERQAGVSRARVMRFLRGTHGLNLSSAEKLAARFGLELVARPRDPNGPPVPRRPSQPRAVEFPLELLPSVKRLVDRMGGIARAREAIEILEKLQSRRSPT